MQRSCPPSATGAASCDAPSVLLLLPGKTMQVNLRHRVAQRVVVPLAKLFVEVLDGEAAIERSSRYRPSIRSISTTGARRSDGARRRSSRPPRPLSRWRSRQRRNVRSLIPSNSAASIWLSSDRSLRPRIRGESAQIGRYSLVNACPVVQPPILGGQPDRTLHELRNPDKPRASHTGSKGSCLHARRKPAFRSWWTSSASPAIVTTRCGPWWPRSAAHPAWRKFSPAALRPSRRSAWRAQQVNAYANLPTRHHQATDTVLSVKPIRRADLPRSWRPLPALGFLHGKLL